MTPKVAPKNTHMLWISISAHSHHTSANSSIILNGICTLLKSSLGTVEIRSHHAHDSSLFIELGKEDVMVIWCGLSRNDDFDQLYVCFCHLQFGWLSNKLHTSDTNHTLSLLSAHSATCFSHSHTSLGLRQSNTSLIKKGCQSISSSSILVHLLSSHSISVTSASSSSTSGFASESIRVEMTDSKDAA